MKEVPKMEVSRGLGITLIMLAVVGMTMFALGAIMSESRHEKCGAIEQDIRQQPTQSVTDAPKQDSAVLPENPCSSVYAKLRKGMPLEELETLYKKHGGRNTTCETREAEPWYGRPQRIWIMNWSTQWEDATPQFPYLLHTEVHATLVDGKVGAATFRWSYVDVDAPVKSK